MVNDDCKGWSTEGIKQFNTLPDMVNKDYKGNRTIIKQWLAERKVKHLDGTQARKIVCPTKSTNSIAK